MIQNLVLAELSSMILLRADCASEVIKSASSRIIILKLGQGYFLLKSSYYDQNYGLVFLVTAVSANFFTFSLTTPIPLSSEALSSSILFL